MTEEPRLFVRAALDRLEAAARAHGGDPLRHIQFATTDADGRPRLRTVVLRGLARDPLLLEIHSDLRAGKIRDLAHAPFAAALAWSPDARLQLRLSGEAFVHAGDEIARLAWETLPAAGRASYGFASRPGQMIARPEEAGRAADPFAQFAVIRLAVREIDVLRLEPAGGQTRAIEIPPEDAAWVGP